MSFKLRLLSTFSLVLLAVFITPTEALAIPIQNLNGATGPNQTFQNDSNVTISTNPSTNVHSFGWAGQLPISRGGTGADSFTAGSLLFSDGSTITQNNSNLFWDIINNRLGIGTSSPTSRLDVSGNAKVTSLTSTADSTINTLTVGLGGGSVLENTVLGAIALPNNTTGTRNVAVGEFALSATTNQSDNTAVGNSALGYPESVNSGEQNTAVGSQALRNTTTGSYNAALGHKALNFNTTGSTNVALGYFTLRTNTTGSGNVALGANSMDNNTTGFNNVAVGSGSTLNSQSDSNSIVIGQGAAGAGDYTTVIGNSSMADVYFGSASALANTHAKKMFLGSSTTPGCIIMGDTAGGVGYITLNNGVLTVSTTPPSACQ